MIPAHDVRARWAAVQRLFDAALAQAPNAREAFVARASVADPSLHAEVLALLRADAAAVPAVLDVTTGALAAAIAQWGPTPTATGAVPAGIAAGRVIGSYRLVREIGRGGMATVYLAARIDGGALVALKVVRDARASPVAVRRLHAERRVLESLHHPSIARILDAGVTDAETPYVVMEYVDGAPIVAACDARRLDLRARLQLLTQVCDAVSYAHSVGVVHRDLKPANVLACVDGTVKLLDFGIAKLLADDAAASARGGVWSGTWLMTPRYAAPEQRRGGAVTTATDVYALGLLLDELVSGRRPPTWGMTAESSRVTGASDESPNVAQARGTTPDRLRRAIAGDIEAIVRRATAHDPAARYGSAAALADDVRRHLAHRPVGARAQTIRYRATVLVRRWCATATEALMP